MWGCSVGRLNYEFIHLFISLKGNNAYIYQQPMNESQLYGRLILGEVILIDFFFFLNIMIRVILRKGPQVFKFFEFFEF